MARYINVDTVSFTDYSGSQYPVKDIREIPQEPISHEVDISENDSLDEVASRADVFGDFGEMQSYRIFDANIVKLTEAGFDVSKLKSLKVPV